MPQTQALTFKPEIANAPLYRVGDSSAAVRDKYGLDEVFKLNSNENPLPPSPAVVAAIQQEAATLNRYPPSDDFSIRHAVADSLGRGTAPDHVITGSGASDVLTMVVRGFLSPGDEAIVCPPTYPAYEGLIRKAAAVPIYAERGANFAYDAQAILDAITERTRLIFLCSPNNPTGSILTQDQLERLMTGLPDHVLLISDEVYHHFTTASDFADSLSYVLAERNILITHSMSKVYGLAGLRLGYGITRPELAEYLARLRHYFHLSQMVLAGGLAALQDRDHLEQTIDLVLTERRRLYHEIAEIGGVTVWPSHTNFLTFQTPHPGVTVAEKLQQQGTIVREMTAFYMPDCLRVTIGLPEENNKFLHCLNQTLQNLE